MGEGWGTGGEVSSGKVAFAAGGCEGRAGEGTWVDVTILSISALGRTVRERPFSSLGVGAGEHLYVLVLHGSLGQNEADRRADRYHKGALTSIKMLVGDGTQHLSSSC